MLNVLYVGWDIKTVEGLAEEFRRAGHELTSTYKKEHALYHITNGNIDVAIVDYDLDCGLDCVGILREIKAYDGKLPVLVITAHNLTKESLRHLIRNLGILKILRKPFERDVVVRAVHELARTQDEITERFERSTRGKQQRRPGVERRCNTRSAVDLPLQFVSLDTTLNEVQLAKVRNVSEGGLLLHTLTEVGSRSRLRTMVRNSGRVVERDVEVLRSRPLKGRYEIAVKFLN